MKMIGGSMAQAPEQSRARAYTVAISVVVHVAAALGLVGISFWKIEKLAAADTGPPLVLRELSPPRGEPEQRQAGPKVAKLKTATPDQMVQPTDKLPEALPEPRDTAAADGARSDLPQCEGCDPDGQGETPFATGKQPGGEDPFGTPSLDSVDLTPPDPDPPPVNVAQEMVEGRRIGGSERILLDDTLLSSLAAQGVTSLRVTAQMCLDARGGTKSISIRTGSGYPAVDETVLRGMEGWRFKAYEVNGKAVPACFVTVFNYTITK